MPRTKTWRGVANGVKGIVKRLRENEFFPDVVVTLGRGGGIFGGLIAGNLGTISVLGIDRVIIGTGREKVLTLVHTESLSTLQGKKVLLVTGEVITASDLSLARKAIESHKPSGLRTASYTVCRTAMEYPDYYAEETRKPTNAPWHIMSHYGRPTKPGWE